MGEQQSGGSKDEEMEFSQLILGFSSAALHYLGEAPLEGGGVAQRNLPLAKQNIDIIGMLQKKTAGNLTPDESTLIEQLLADLRLKFVEATTPG